jgi:hypothetical protein
VAGPAAATALLVLARFRLRLRERWDVAIDTLDAARRMPAWNTVDAARFAAVSRRADVLADLIAAHESGAASPASSATLAPGALVLQKRRGVTVVLASRGAHVLVAAYRSSRAPYPRVVASSVSPLHVPLDVGQVMLRAPTDLPS